MIDKYPDSSLNTGLPLPGSLLVILVLLASLLFVPPALAQQPNSTEQLESLKHMAAVGVTAAHQNNVASMQAEYEEIHEAWESFEDDLRAQDPTAYIEIEGALGGIKEALQSEPLDPIRVELAYNHLADEATEIAAELQGNLPATATADETVSPADLMKSLDTAYSELEDGELAEAAEYLESAIRAWPAVEGVIASSSPDAYTAIEIDLSRARAALETQPADLSGAEAAIERLRGNLAPFTTGQTYSMFDAAAIILREGLEALLVIVALLAFLQRSGNSDKRGWIWAGGLLGIVVSLMTAFGLHAVFNYASNGQNREVIEGVTGLIAAGLLFYVSYWLHSKANLRSWQKYINTRTTQALARGSLAGLSLLAFLAVFREGAETTIFYLGMASSIAFRDLWLGLGLGLAILAVIATLMFKVGLKLPLRPFFQIAGLLVYYLGFKFLGAGIHALQIGGVLPASPISWLPAWPIIGLFPTWQTVLPQLLLLGGSLLVWLYLRTQEREAQSSGVSIPT